MTFRHACLLLGVVLLVASVAQAKDPSDSQRPDIGNAAATWPQLATENPYAAKSSGYDCELLIVGGSSGGMGAAITAGRLGVDTVYVIRAPGDVAGLLGCCMNIDSDLPMRYLGGLPAELDTLARYTSGLDYSKLGDHGAGFSAPSHVYFRYIRPQLDSSPNLQIIAGYYPVAVEKDAGTGRVAAVRFKHRRRASDEIVVRPKVTIDAEVEGDVMALSDVSWTLRREGRHTDTDPTRDNETYAGKIFQRRYKVTRENIVLPESSHEADTDERTTAWNAILVLKSYPKQNAIKTSPWILKRPPAGYDQIDPDSMTSFSGIAMGGQHVRSLAHRTLSYIEGWRMPDGRHVLLSMKIKDREANEKKHLAFALAHLYRLQHVHGKIRTGLADEAFEQHLPPKYTLKDFGTETFGGDMPLPSLIYMRQGRRMVNDHVFGGKLIEDDGSGIRVQRRPPSARAAFFNAMLIDHHPVSNEYAKQTHSRPEGWMLLRLEGLYDFGTPPIPFDVFIPRPSEATGLLIANAGAYTHQAYAAFPRMEPGRILQGHACAALAYQAIRRGTPVHDTDLAAAQLTLLCEHGQSIVYQPDSFSGTKQHVVDQMLAARGVPPFDPKNPFAKESTITQAEATAHLKALAVAEVAKTFGDSLCRPKLFASSATDISSSAARLTLAEAVSAIGSKTDRELPDRPIRFSEWKRLLFNTAFAEPYGIAPARINLAEPLAWDTFSRPDGPLGNSDSGHPWSTVGDWTVGDGAARARHSDQRRRACVKLKTDEVALGSDIYLEQTREGAAGLVIRDGASRTAVRFLLVAKNASVTAQLEIESDAKTTFREEKPLGKLRRRGFHIEMVLDADSIECFVDGVASLEAARPTMGRSLEVGVVNEPGISSWFDNFQASGGRHLWP